MIFHLPMHHLYYYNILSRFSSFTNMFWQSIYKDANVIESVNKKQLFRSTKTWSNQGNFLILPASLRLSGFTFTFYLSWDDTFCFPILGWNSPCLPLGYREIVPLVEEAEDLLSLPSNSLIITPNSICEKFNVNRILNTYML